LQEPPKGILPLLPIINAWADEEDAKQGVSDVFLSCGDTRGCPLECLSDITRPWMERKEALSVYACGICQLLYDFIKILVLGRAIINI
jgi:hypothetical protein